MSHGVTTSNSKPSPIIFSRSSAKTLSSIHLLYSNTVFHHPVSVVLLVLPQEKNKSYWIIFFIYTISWELNSWSIFTWFISKNKKKNPLFSFQEIVLIGFLIIQFFLSSAEWFRFQRDDKRKASNNSIRWRCKNQRNSVRNHQTKNPRIINYLYFEIEFDKITYYFRCCVCLGEFKVNEELHLLPSCKHFFHMDCIRLWLHSNTTCPLCRCSVTTKNSSHSHEPLHHVSRPNDETVVQTTEVGIRMEQQEHPIMVGLSIDNNCTEQQQQRQIVPHEQSSSSSSGSRNSGVFENGINLLESESVVINIQTHDTWEGEQGLSIRPLFCFNPTKVSFFNFFFSFFLIRKQTLIRPFSFTETDWEFVYAFLQMRFKFEYYLCLRIN